MHTMLAIRIVINFKKNGIFIIIKRNYYSSQYTQLYDYSSWFII